MSSVAVITSSTPTQPTDLLLLQNLLNNDLGTTSASSGVSSVTSSGSTGSGGSTSTTTSSEIPSGSQWESLDTSANSWDTTRFDTYA